MAYDPVYYRIRRDRLRAAGICRNCKANSPDKTYCVTCSARRNARTQADRDRHTEYMRIRRYWLAAVGICTGCGIGKCAAGHRCDACRHKRRERWKTHCE